MNCATESSSCLSMKLCPSISIGSKPGTILTFSSRESISVLLRMAAWEGEGGRWGQSGGTKRGGRAGTRVSGGGGRTWVKGGTMWAGHWPPSGDRRGAYCSAGSRPSSIPPRVHSAGLGTAGRNRERRAYRHVKRRGYVWREVEGGELSRPVLHRKGHLVILPLQTVLDAQLSKQAEYRGGGIQGGGIWAQR